MLTIVVLAASLFVVPTYLSVAIFKGYFPHHTLRISDANLIPLGVGFSILVNSWVLYFASDLVVPVYCSNQLASDAGYTIARHPLQIAGVILLLTALPVLASWGICHYCECCWLKFLKVKFGATDIGLNQIEKWIAHSVEKALNHMGKLTIHDTDNCSLMVDILDDKDSLYSGIYTNYHTEGGQLAGISLSRVIRFAFKGESARKKDKSDAGDGEIPYLLPNQGEMYFPNSKIQNFHFWQIKREQLFAHDFESPTEQVLAAWHLIVKQALPKLGIRVIARLGKNDDATPFGRVLRKIQINLADLEIKEKGKPSPGQ